MTDFKRHPVRFLSRAANGTLAFTHDGELYTASRGHQRPAKVAVDIKADFPTSCGKIGSRGAAGATASPNGKLVAFPLPWRCVCDACRLQHHQADICHTRGRKRPQLGQRQHLVLHIRPRRPRKYISRHTRPSDRLSPTSPMPPSSARSRCSKPTSTSEPCPNCRPTARNWPFILDRNKLAVMDMKSKRVTGAYRRLDAPSAQRTLLLHVVARFAMDSPRDNRPQARSLLRRGNNQWRPTANTNTTNSGYFRRRALVDSWRQRARFCLGAPRYAQPRFVGVADGRFLRVYEPRRIR